MKSISRYLRRLCEEKIIAREDDGGAPIGGGAGGGDVVSGGDSSPSDVVSDEPPSATGLTTTDVLGKCDHRKDGVFGPGCFHLPHMLWSVPCYRYPGKRKKKRRLKYSNVVNETDDFEFFRKDVELAIEREIDSVDKYLFDIDDELRVEYNPDYEFDGEREDWIAALDKEDQDDAKTFIVAFNLKALYKFLFDKGLEMDEREIELQVRVSLWHEVGHALIQYFQDQEIYDFELSPIEEEKLVEEFARYRIRKYSGVYKSKLNDFVKEMFIEGDGEDGEPDSLSETKGDVLTDFKHPINLNDTKRFISKNDE